ncbi:GFA family protein [Gluconobacter sp. Dm-62]|uniref:GFA family protein n=1 Tax=Gluconobacter sp. Dm-62 TaxID=2799804 RepID=UPI001B8BE9BF|nr:GFA family protein [Gluconobacter sp. Dm-62]MBS1104032.1 GFA family protein [Gluconobacter sp. Dm-62]
MTDIIKNQAGGCHCGAVRFEVSLSDGFKLVRRCNCSYCRMRGSVVAMTALDGIKILQGENMLTTYRFNTGTAQHFFCSRCGIHTHHQRRSDPNRHAVNVACLDGVSPFDFPEVPVTDGINHPNDTGMLPQIAGTLRFESASER